MANSYQISPLSYEFQNYQGKDTSLITSFDIDSFINSSNYIEFHIYDLENNLVSSTLDFKDYQVFNDPTSLEQGISRITLDPADDIENKLSNQGSYVAYYNFLTKQIGDPNTNLFISEISSDKKEIRLESTALSNLDIIEQANNFINFRNSSNYFVDFYINFGQNDLVIANNIKLENENTPTPSILVKLYEPLSSDFDIKSLAWIVTNINEPEAYRVDFPQEDFDFIGKTFMSGPNFNIPIKDQVNNSSQNLSENDILSNPPSSSYNQLQNIISSSAININVDYSNFNNFIHFSSAETRLENFQYKLGLLESYSASLSDLSAVTSSQGSKTILNNKITNLISNFDGYEYYLYYTSGSKAWPKTTSLPPYDLAKINSSEALTWIGSTNESNSNYGGQLLSASNYDNANPDELKKSIPEYLREDPQNKPYDLFVDMVAQYYDNVWLYTKDITEKYNADNRLDFGVSKDLVADAIKDFGLKLYQNNFSNSELYTAFLGITPNGSLFPFPEITESLPTPTGFEFVDTLISASNDVISMDDTNKSLYKRIYHNIPYLLKTKGTLTGLRALITSYGIPDTILKISEFGGKDQVNANDWDLYFNNFNYAWNTQGTNNLSTPWEVNSLFQSQPESSPGTVEFRFKTNGIPPKPEAPSTTVISASMMIKGFKTTNHTNDTAIIENVQTNATSFDDFLSLCPQKLFFASVSNGRFGWYGQLSGGGSWSSNYRKSASILDITASSSLGEYEVILTGSDYFKNRRSIPNQTLPYSASIVSGSFEVLNEAVVPDAGGGVFNYGGPISQTLTPTNSQALWLTNSGSIINKAIVLEYSGSYLESGSYLGSIPDPYNKYGTLKYISNPGTANETSCSVYLPFFDGDWWSVMVRNNGFSNDINYIITEPYIYDFIIGEDSKYIVEEAASTSSRDNLGNINLYASNKIYNGNDGTSLGFFATSSINNTSASGSWFSGITSSFAKGFTTGSTYNNFSGSIQEIRYYNVALGTTSFKDYTMNPLSYEGNGINSAPNQLTFRAALGSELDITTSSSIHPKVTGSWTSTASFSGSNNIFNFNTSPLYKPNTEYFFLDQPAVGIKNRTTDKIRSENDTIPSGNVLSPMRSLSQTTEASASYTDNINYLEVAFSPQNQINDDIIGQMGHFNIGDYIGDPSQRFAGNNYPDLNSLSEEYFKKYIKQYDLTDFVRLIKFFDNSLFKMIKDFTPVRTSLASGLVIKQHLLERNKYPQPSVSFENTQYTGSIDTAFISGGAGGVFNVFNGLETSPAGTLGTGPKNRFGITQSYSVTTPSLSGSVTKIHDSQDEFYDGEFSGSNITVTNGNLNVGCFGEAGGVDLFGVRIYNSTLYSLNKFLDFENNPKQGYISLFSEPIATSSFVPPPPSPPTPPATVFNTPTTIELIKYNTIGGTYSSDIFSISSQTQPNWTLNEKNPPGTLISFSGSINPVDGYNMIFKNQLGEVIQGITLNSIEITQPNNGNNDITSKFTGTVQNTSVVGYAQALRLETASPFVFTSSAATETLKYTISVSSSNTTSTTTNTLDGNTFELFPSASWNNKGTEYSLGNNAPSGLNNSSITLAGSTLTNNLITSGPLSSNDRVWIFTSNFGSGWSLNKSTIVTDTTDILYSGNPFLKNGTYQSGASISDDQRYGLQAVGFTGTGTSQISPAFICNSSYSDISTSTIYNNYGILYRAYDYFKFNFNTSGAPQVSVVWKKLLGFLNYNTNADWTNGTYYLLFTVRDGFGSGVNAINTNGGTDYWLYEANIIG